MHNDQIQCLMIIHHMIIILEPTKIYNRIIKNIILCKEIQIQWIIIMIILLKIMKIKYSSNKWKSKILLKKLSCQMRKIKWYSRNWEIKLGINNKGLSIYKVNLVIHNMMMMKINMKFKINKMIKFQDFQMVVEASSKSDWK